MNITAVILRAFSIGVFVITASSVSADRVARILYYGAPKNAPKTAFVYQNQTTSQEVELSRYHFSDSFDIPAGDAVLKFLPRELLTDESVPESAPQLKIPKEWKKVLILVSEDLNNKTFPIRLNAIDASDDVFGQGEILFFNFSEVSVFGMVGEKKLILKPETTALISDPISDKGDYLVELDSIRNTIETRRWLLRQTWHHQPKYRYVAFVLPMPKPRVAKIYSTPIRDF